MSEEEIGDFCKYHRDVKPELVCKTKHCKPLNLICHECAQEGHLGHKVVSGHVWIGNVKASLESSFQRVKSLLTNMSNTEKRLFQMESNLMRLLDEEHSSLRGFKQMINNIINEQITYFDELARSINSHIKKVADKVRVEIATLKKDKDMLHSKSVSLEKMSMGEVFNGKNDQLLTGASFPIKFDEDTDSQIDVVRAMVSIIIV